MLILPRIKINQIHTVRQNKFRTAIVSPETNPQTIRKLVGRNERKCKKKINEEYPMMKSRRIFTVLMIMMVSVNLGWSHCQVPCGIYGDKLRIDLLNEHITTIEKSMNQINELSKDAGANMNQLVRWVENKDKHADEFTEIVTYYFLAQRIKITDPANAADYKAYQDKLTALHQMMVYAMKAKQTTDPANTAKLSELVDQFAGMYFSPEDLKHLKSTSDHGAESHK
jgi:nickel superoxide dismutase